MPRYREILSHPEMTHREGIALQKGMNFRVRGGSAGYSIILKSVRKGAPGSHATDRPSSLRYLHVPS
jgi:hypothetical protein